MRQWLQLLSGGVLCLALAACMSEREEIGTSPVAESLSAEQAAANLGNPLLANRGDLNAVNVSVNSSEELEKIDNGSNDELIWTNPDDPDAEISELTQAFENKKLGYGWLNDLGQAIQLARKQEKPLLVWFHDSLISPKSNALGVNYLETKEFDSWCRDRVVRVRLDSGASLDEATMDRAKYSSYSVNALQKRYGLTKKPSFAIITPAGKISARLDGFDGMLSGFALDLKNGVAKAEKDYAQYKKGLIERGYREWRSRRGDKRIFGKLMRYDQEKKLVYLKEAGGRVTRTKLSSFCQEDEDYLLSLPQPKERTRNRSADE